MTVLALAGLLAQTPPAMPSTRPLVRRGVDTAPRVAPGDITIRNTGSTNFAGYTVVVHATGDVDVTVNGATTPKSLPAPQTKWLFQKVRGATPLDALPGAGCMKSASFGSTTTVSYGGTTSPDITCGGDPVIKEIARTVGAVLTLLDVHPRRPLPPPAP